MKSTKLKKKLALNKKTVVNLRDVELNQVKGGLPWTDWGVFTCKTRAQDCTDFCPEPPSYIC